MKLKILVKIVEKLLGMTCNDDEPRADMFLPDRLLAIAMVFLAAGLACGIYSIFRLATWSIICTLLGIVLGTFALLCWKNQTIHIVSEDTFTYTTMFGNTRTYAFSDIQALRRNQDSLTLFVAGEKVHIESMAILSDRLVKAINAALTPGTKHFQTPAEQLLQLPDDELIYALWSRVENIVLSQNDMSQGFLSLNEEQRIFYAVNYLDMEVNNGGICQFFVNSSRMVAPVVGEYMGMIGADAHQKLYEEFIKTHQIDTGDLSSFDCDTVEDFQKQYARYPFDKYDTAFCELEPLQHYLVAYVKEKIEKF